MELSSSYKPLKSEHRNPRQKQQEQRREVGYSMNRFHESLRNAARDKNQTSAVRLARQKNVPRLDIDITRYRPMQSDIKLPAFARSPLGPPTASQLAVVKATDASAADWPRPLMNQSLDLPTDPFFSSIDTGQYYRPH